MKKIFITLLVILSIIFVNIFDLQAFWYSKKAKDFYDKKEYEKALEIYKKLDNKNNYFNIGDILYKLGETQKDSEKKLVYWEKSLDFFLKAMKQNYTKESEFNYNFVKKKIEELKKKMQEEQKKKQQNQKQENKQNSRNSEENNKQEKNKDSKNKKNQNGKNGENQKDGKSNQNNDKQNSQEKQNNQNSGEQKDGKQSEGKKNSDSKKQGQKGENTQKSGDNQENKNLENQEKTNSKQESNSQEQQKNQSQNNLSKRDLDTIQAYKQKLIQDQNKNSDNFNKVYEENNSPFDNLDDFFGDDPFFDNSFLNKNEDKKDW